MSIGGVSAAELLRMWRERALLTQQQLAKRAGLSARTVRRLEAGDVARPQVTTLRLLASGLELSAAEERRLVAGHSGAPDVALPERVAPRQLPAVPPAFTGRVAELAGLEDLGDEAATVVISTIDGMAGIGKTALAIHAAHRVAGRFPDGQLFLDLHGYTDGVPPVDAAEGLDRLLRALGVSGEQVPEHLEDRAALYRSRLAGRKVLVLLDNAVSDAQVRPLLPGTPGCLVLVTSRRRLTGLDQTHALSLDVLSTTDAIDLFGQVAGPQRAAGGSGDGVAEVVELCGRLPLAIRIAAARLRSRPAWTVQHLVERLVDHRDRLDALDAGHRSVSAALDLSYHQLDGELQRAYRLLGLHPGADVERDAVAALTAATPAGAERLIGELLEASLLLELTPGRYRFHDLVRAHAGATAARDDAGPEGREAITRLLDHYRDTAASAIDIVHPTTQERQRTKPTDTSFPDAASANAWLDSELSNLLAVTLHAAEHGWPRHAVQLTVTLHRLLRSRGPFVDAEQLYLHVLDSVQERGDRAGQAEVLVCLGEIRWPQARGDSAAECFERALTTARDLALATVEVDALAGLAAVERLQGRFQNAVGICDEALTVARRASDSGGEIAALICLAWAELDLGRPSVEHPERALTIARAIGNPHEEVRALRCLGHVHRLQGQRKEAADAFERTLVLARSIGSRSATFGALLGIGMIHRLEGRYAEAGPLYEQALTLALEIGDVNSQFEAHQALGRLHLSAGHAGRALGCHQAALDAAVALNHAGDQVRAHDGLAHAHLAVDQHEHARRHWQEALDILTRLGVETTHDEEATVPQIRARLGRLSAPG
ncbi:ATP-binding protein [Pseudonocardia sp. TRM90224]|uniref:ATP-binding protein n=1 Tax=Pseudonocardia sp. TRM90224 TaxID=2812678 RepID=UPI001E60AE0F|nr:helix-turn-helix domain-containing protein [Pseudonocardia sp. TRM90224]